MKALILDEPLELAPHVRRVLIASGSEASFACSLNEFDLAARTCGPPDLTIVNLTPPLTAWQVSHHLKSLAPHTATLVLFDRDSAWGLQHLKSLPGVECLERPASATALETLLKRVLSQFRAPVEPRESASRRRGEAYGGIIGESRELREVLARIDKVAPGDANVCVVGESGTGKELIARAIHQNSPRRDRPLVTLDCTAIPEGLMESQLFGHVRGSFTGAVENRDGVFSLAHTGTLFIDEISELSLPLQAKLLRVIQTREFVKVGGTKPVRTDIRLITASNKDLRAAVEEGTFREDLYYRIAVVMINVPPLRERREDIPLLAEHFLRKFSAAHRKPLPVLTPQALELLTAYDWPGNVRQLENCIEQAVVLCEGDVVDVDALPLADTTPKRTAEAAGRFPLGLTLREVEQEYILRTLKAVGGNRTRAARLLGISLRCLQYKLKAYNQGASEPAPRVDGAPETQHPLGV
jgi:DNA-binding NtrC family response regulator